MVCIFIFHCVTVQAKNMIYIPSLPVSLFWFTFSRTIYRGTQWICSSKYLSSGKFLLGREIWKKCYVLGRNVNVLLGNSQFRVSEGIQKGCRYVATPSQSLCQKKLIKCPVPRASVLDETSHQENGFQVKSAPIASTLRSSGFI